MVYFLLYLFIEVMVSSSISSYIGGLSTFFELILSAIIGIVILQNFPYSLMESIAQARSGQITQDEFIKTNVARAIGAVLLIVPGFFTDIVGVLLQFDFFILFFSKIFSFKKVDETKKDYTNKGVNDEIIDVEVIDDNSSIKY